ncbi:MAG: hypothetical protein M1821_002613 [Bathelium mastoideum]|nr:MAG: hypothetical protein M1821_002613 [Bathelium mastoideum]
MYASHARLLYWPVTTVGGDLCGKAGSTIENTPTIPGKPNTVIFDNTTLTSPTVYFSFDTFGPDTNSNCGTQHTNVLFPMDPNSVSTIQGARALIKSFPFNYADLQTTCVTSEGKEGCFTLVPAAAYEGQASCFENADVPSLCSTISPGYNPYISMPQQVLTYDPQWGPSCFPYPDGVWDPPHALQQAQSAALPVPVTTMVTPMVSASPGSGPTVTGPSQTSVVDPWLESTSVPIDPKPSSSEDPKASDRTNGGVSATNEPEISKSSTASVGGDPGSLPAGGDNSPSLDPGSYGSQPIPANSESQGSDPGQTRGGGNPGAAIGSLIAGGIGASRASSSTADQVTTETAAQRTQSADPKQPVTTTEGQSGGDPDATAGEAAGENIGSLLGSGDDPANSKSIAPGDGGSSAEPIASVGGQSIFTDPSGHGVVIGTSTINAGQQMTLSGMTVSVGTSFAVVGDSTFAVSAAASSIATESNAVFTAAGHVYSAAELTGGSDGSSFVKIGNQVFTLDGGDTTATLTDGAVVVLGSSRLEVDGSTASFSAVTTGLTAAPIKGAEFALGTSSFKALLETGGGSSNVIVMDGETMFTMGKGRATVVNGDTLSWDSNGVVAVQQNGVTSTASWSNGASWTELSDVTFGEGSTKATAFLEVDGSGHSEIIVDAGGTTYITPEGESVVAGGATLERRPSGTVVVESDGTSSTISRSSSTADSTAAGGEVTGESTSTAVPSRGNGGASQPVSGSLTTAGAQFTRANWQLLAWSLILPLVVRW